MMPARPYTGGGNFMGRDGSFTDYRDQALDGTYGRQQMEMKNRHPSTPMTDTDSSGSNQANTSYRKNENISPYHPRSLSFGYAQRDHHRHHHNHHNHHLVEAYPVRPPPATVPARNGSSAFSTWKDRNALPNENQPVHYRTNFSRGRGYVPPATGVPPMLPPRSQHKGALAEEELPFDQKREGIPPNPVALPFDEAPQPSIERPSSDGERTFASKKSRTRAYFSENDQSREEPDNAITPFQIQESNEGNRELVSPSSPPPVATTNENLWKNGTKEIDSEMGQTQTYEEFGIAGGSVTDGSFSADRVLVGSPFSEQIGDDDDDSLFDFAEEQKQSSTLEVGVRKVPMKKGSQRRARRERRTVRMEDDEEDDDDTSLEHDYGVVTQRPTSLQERAQHAFSSRNKTQQKTQQRSSLKKSRKSKPPIVSFDKKPDTIHHFQLDDETTHTTELSLNSEYTKSLESEVEDVIKDLLFIGSGKASNPGRRAYKYQPARKRVIQDEGGKSRKSTLRSTPEDEDSSFGNTGDDTTYTYDESTHDGTSTRLTVNTTNTEDTYSTLGSAIVHAESDGTSLSERKEMHKNQDDEDPISAMWGFVEGSVTAVTEALGLTSAVKCADACKKADKNHVDNRQTLPDELPANSMARRSISPPDSPRGRIPETSALQRKVEVGDNKGEDESGGDDKGGDNNDDEVVKEKSPKQKPSPKRSDPPKPRPVIQTKQVRRSLMNDPYLGDLAVHTARVKHELNNCILDEKIDVITHVKFNVVKIGLPLGILFQENGGGCWVAKVYPTGNAALNFRGDRVELGDQLAEVDGASAIKMKVDDICSLFAEASNPKEIELTFLRYTGPMQSAQEKENEPDGEARMDMETVEPPTREWKEGLATERPATNRVVPNKRQMKLAKLNNSSESRDSERERRFRWFGRSKNS